MQAELTVDLAYPSTTNAHDLPCIGRSTQKRMVPFDSR